jgi:hypothetical protein
MSRLTKQQQDLILDFYFRCGDQESINRGRDLIASNPEAATLYDGLELALKELDSDKYEPVPDNLVEITIARLKIAASRKNVRFGLFRSSWIQVTAAAAMFLITAGIGFPVFSNLRHNAWKTTCVSNLERIGQAIGRYAGDHDNQMPYVPMKAGSLWNRVGDQGSENQSNTRHTWFLVRLGYAPSADFVCPGDRQSKVYVGDADSINKLNDFPCHRNISYSYQLMWRPKQLDSFSSGRALLSDQNPLFEKSCFCPSQHMAQAPTSCQVSDLEPAYTSHNHGNRGQSILLADLSVDFRGPQTTDGDNIFLLNGLTEYQGNETPFDDGSDTFLAP